jgi:hypothetical protein
MRWQIHNDKVSTWIAVRIDSFHTDAGARDTHDAGKRQCLSMVMRIWSENRM